MQTGLQNQSCSGRHRNSVPLSMNGQRAVLGSQQPPTGGEAQTYSALLSRLNALRAEDGSRSGFGAVASVPNPAAATSSFRPSSFVIRAFLSIFPRDHFQGWVFRVLLSALSVASIPSPSSAYRRRQRRWEGFEVQKGWGFSVCSVAATCSAWDRVIGSASLPARTNFKCCQALTYVRRGSWRDSARTSRRSPTVLTLSQRSSGRDRSNRSSTAMMISMTVSESAPRSSMIRESGLNCSRATSSCSTRMS